MDRHWLPGTLIGQSKHRLPGRFIADRGFIARRCENIPAHSYASRARSPLTTKFISRELVNSLSGLSVQTASTAKQKGHLVWPFCFVWRRWRDSGAHPCAAPLWGRHYVAFGIARGDPRRTRYASSLLTTFLRPITQRGTIWCPVVLLVEVARIELASASPTSMVLHA